MASLRIASRLWLCGALLYIAVARVKDLAVLKTLSALGLLALISALLATASSAQRAASARMQLSFVRSQSIFLAEPDGTKQRVVLRAKRQGKSGSGIDEFYGTHAWSRSGRLAVTHQYTNGHYFMDIAIRLPGSLRTSGDLISSYDPTWSRDGQRVLFAAQTQSIAGVDTLWVTRLPSTHASVLNTSPYFKGAAEPSWSPDGTRIAFVVHDLYGRYSELFVSDLAGKSIRRLARAPARNPSWSPDNRQIVFEGGGRLYLINADGAGVHLLYKPLRARALNPAWSPDGRVIAFTQQRSVWVIKPGGGAPHRLIKNATAPAWKPGSF